MSDQPVSSRSAEIERLKQRIAELEERVEADSGLAAQVRLQQSYLDLLFESVTDAVSIIAPDRRVVRANAAFTQLFGYTQAELVGQRISDFAILEADRTESRNYFEQALTGRRVEFETIRRHKDGSLLEVRLIELGIRSEGRVTGVFVIYQDLSARRRTEAALRASEERFRLFMDHFPGHAFIKDHDGRYVYTNITESGFYGRTRGEVVGLTDAELYPAEAAESYSDHDREVIRTGTDIERVQTSRVQGRKRYFLANKFPIPVADGPDMLGGLAIDITERVEAEEEVRTSAAQYRDLVELSSSLILRVDPQGRVIFINNFAQEFFGYSEEEILGRSILGTIVPAEDSRGTDLAARIRDLLGRPEDFRTHENENVNRTGERVWIAWNNSPILDSEGRVVEILSIGHDITTRRRAEEALAGRLVLERIVASISSRFQKVSADNLEAELEWAIERMGRFSAVDRSYLFVISEDDRTMSNTHEWCAPGVAPEIENLQEIPLEAAQWLIDRLRRSEIIHIPRVAELPEEAASEKEILEAQDILSLVLVPVMVRDRLAAYMGFDSVSVEKDWAEEDVILLQTTAELFGAAMARVRAERELRMSEERYRQLIDNSPLGILTLDRNGNITQTNHQMETLIDIFAVEQRGEYTFLNYPRLVESGISGDIRLCLEGGVNLSINRPLKDAQGKLRHMRYHLVPHRDEAGHIQGLQATVEDFTVLQEAENRIKDHERYLAALLQTLKAGVIVIDAETHRVLEVNQYAAELIGSSPREIIGRPCHGFIGLCEEGACPVTDGGEHILNEERILPTSSGELPVLKSITWAEREGRRILVETFTDISELKKLFEEQRIDIGLAKDVLRMINGRDRERVELGQERTLAIRALSLACHAEGGDHYFIRELPVDHRAPEGRTMISLKDQSGHQVGCVLRSILTDLIHQSLITRRFGAEVEKTMADLNEMLCRGEILPEGDFFTGVCAELDHRELVLRYVSCGHPRSLLLRDGQVSIFPEAKGRPGANPPMGVIHPRPVSFGEVRLQEGDRLIFYTDGLLEVPLKKVNGRIVGRSITTEELAEMVRELDRGWPGTEIETLLATLVKEVGRVSEVDLDPAGVNESGDDITLLGLEIESHAGFVEEIWRPTGLHDLQESINRFILARRDEWRERGFERPARLRLAFEEAVANSWFHGNRAEPGRAISIRYRFGNDFTVEVADKGLGFDPDRLPDPLSRSGRLRVNGRGVLLMRGTADEVRFNETGNRVSLVFKKTCPSETGILRADQAGFDIWRRF